MGRVREAREVLKEHFGFGDFRDPQQQVVASILERRDTLVIMPTGGGKSLCYQLPALMMDGVTLVVSPLIALMKDQVDALQARNIPAAMINSSQSWDEQREVLERMRGGGLKLVYVSPERFRAGSFVRALESAKIAMLAIDEAHCISQWGHDFRPDYMRLGEILGQIGRPLCSAFTATATPDVREDIQRQLGLKDPAVFVSGFARDNLSFNITAVDRKIDKSSRLRTLIGQHRTGIIYCATRKSVEAVSAELKEDNIAHCAYHAGLSNTERKAAQDLFMRGEVPVAVATSAFGMGIDRADIRFVCHYEMPGSVEAFYQEAGRAGRDGQPAWCEMLFMYSDKRVQDFFVEGANPDVRKIREVYDFIRAHCNDKQEMFLPVDEVTEGLSGRNNPMAVHTALGHLVRRGYLERFDVPGEQLRGTRLLQPALTGRELELPEDDLMEKRRRDLDKLKAVVQMAYAKECRQAWILRYFGEPVAADCTRCDTCARESSARSLHPDEFVVVQKALSGVARMSDRLSRYEWQPRYGRTKIMQCLAGKSDERFSQAGLDTLPTYGILKEYGAKFIRELFESMEEAGLIEVDQGEYPLLGLTGEGAQVMFGEAEVALEWPEPSGSKPARKKKKSAPTADEVEDREMYRRLVALRDRMRRARGNAPAYTIFPNTVLAQLADRKPETAEAAMEIKGIGPAKAASVLPEFLALIADEDGEAG